MSTESSLDAQLIEQTKQQIRSLVGEIAQLSKSDIAPAEFYAKFLDRIVSALAAVGGAVWVVEEDGRLALQYQINLQEARLGESEQRQTSHARLLYKTLADGQPALVPPHSGTADDQEAANPTDYLIVLGVLQADVKTMGLVEIFQRSDAGPNAQRGYLRFVVQMCELAAEYLKTYQLKHFTSRQVLWSQLEEFCRVVHAGLDPRATAYTIANEGRRLIECDKLSVAIARGRRCVIEAISGQDIFDKRSNNVRLMERLAAAVTATGEPMWYTGDTRDLAPQVEDAVEEYVDESHSKLVAVLPLLPPVDETEETPSAPKPPLGALIVEQIEDSRIPEGFMQRAEVVAGHSTLALANSLEHQNLFLMPVWRAIGHSRIVTQARYLPWTISISAAVVVVVLVLFLWPAEFRMQASGSLEPVVQHDVFATTKGVVHEVLVDHGSRVRQGDPLIKLRDSELEIQLAELQGQTESAEQHIVSLQRMLLEPRGMNVDERLHTEGEIAEQRERVVSLRTQWDLLKQKEAQLIVHSPIDGEVVSWNVDQLLNRPVDRGQVLLRVADPEGDWHLELHMPENRMGHVADALQARQERQAKLPPEQWEKDVSFQLATDPGQSFYGRVQDVQKIAEVRGEEGNTVLIDVAINKNELPHLQLEMSVTGKVDCGRASLGYVWLHDVWAFIQSRIIFRYF